MNEVIIVTEITAKCADGSTFYDVTMKLVDDVVCFESTDEQYLFGDRKVVRIESGKSQVDPLTFSLFNSMYRNQEEQL